MEDKKFAFESGEVSIAFVNRISSLGDTLISRKVFDALIELVPNCSVDVFYVKDVGAKYIQAFYGQSKNLNQILSFQDYYQNNSKNYDVALRVWHNILVDNMNNRRLEELAPALLKSLNRINDYNKKNPQTNDVGVILRNITRAHILGTNRYTCLSCDGALPIHDNHVDVPLTTESERQFQELNLSKSYITIGSNLKNTGTLHRHTLKEWPTPYVIEYISLLNKKFPQKQIVQIGGGGVNMLPNADRYIIDEDLELVKYVLKNSLLHVDCESGLVHLSTQLGTKCLVLFGPTDVEYFGFKENLNFVSDFCHPCYHAWVNGSACLRGAKEPPCMLSHTPQQVFEATCNYLHQLDGKLEYRIPYLQKNVKIPCDYLNQLV